MFQRLRSERLLNFRKGSGFGIDIFSEREHIQLLLLIIVFYEVNIFNCISVFDKQLCSTKILFGKRISL